MEHVKFFPFICGFVQSFKLVLVSLCLGPRSDVMVHAFVCWRLVVLSVMHTCFYYFQLLFIVCGLRWYGVFSFILSHRRFPIVGI